MLSVPWSRSVSEAALAWWLITMLSACHGTGETPADDGSAPAAATQRLTTLRLSGHSYGICGLESSFEIGFCAPASTSEAHRWDTQPTSATRGKAATPSGPGPWRDRGIVHLALKEAEPAVADLQAALALAPADPRLLNDLAVALWLHSLETDDPRPLATALETLEKAMAEAAVQGTELPEVMFNRALLLSHLGLHRSANDAWDAYLSIDSGSPWASEAQLWQRRVQAPRLLSWESQVATFEQALQSDDTQQLDVLVQHYPEEVRVYGERELLGAWARAMAKDGKTEAASLLTSTQRIALTRQRVLDDASMAEAVTAIENAQRLTDPEPLSLLVNGHLAFVDGLDALSRGDSEASASAFDRARTSLEEAGSPYAAQSELEVLRCLYRQNRYAEVALRADTLISSPGMAPGGELRIRSLWIQGSALLVLGRSSEGLRSYEQALALTIQHRDVVRQGILHMMVASAYGELGDLTDAWHHRLGALRLLAGREADPRLGLAVAEAAYGAQQLDLPWAALTLQREAVALADAKKDPLPQVIARRNQASMLGRLGKRGAALETLHEASQLSWQIVDLEQRRWAQVDLRFEEARWMLSHQPEMAIEQLSAVLAAYQDSDFEIFLPWVLHLRAKAHQLVADAAAAERDLQSALDHLDRLRSLRLSQEHRFSFIDDFQTIYDDLLQLQIAAGEPSVVLATMERARSRLLLDRLDRGRMPLDNEAPLVATTRPVDELVSLLPDDATYVAFHSLTDRLLVTVLQGGEIRAQEYIDLTAADLQTKILGLATGTTREQALGLANLHRLLLGRITRHLSRGQPLVVVPHGALFGLPFAALMDPATGRFLVQDHPLLIVPSLNVLLALQAKVDNRPPLPLDGLILADPAFDRSLFPATLSRLPRAADEGVAVAGLLKPSRLLQGEDASRAALMRHMGSYTIVHLSVHGLANAEAPLRSRLALAPEADDSGVLYGQDLVTGISLQRTRLVVLAACRSAAGGNSPSEGVTGLVWPLLAGGVPQVIATVLPVDDAATSAFTERFYRHLVSSREPLDALHSAQVETIRIQTSEESPNIFDWSAFQLYGSLTATSLPSRPQSMSEASNKT